MELLQRNLFLVACVVLILDPHVDGGGGPSKRSRKGECVCSVSLCEPHSWCVWCVCVRQAVNDYPQQVQKILYQFPCATENYFAFSKIEPGLSIQLHGNWTVRSSNYGRGRTFLYSLKCLHWLWTHPVFYSVNTGILSWGVKQTRSSFYHLSASRDKVKNKRSYIASPPICFHGVGRVNSICLTKNK